MAKIYIDANLKFLRKRKKRTQEDISGDLGINRATYSGYENAVSSVSIEMLIAFSTYYGISIDDLILTDLRLLTEYDLRFKINKKPNI